MDFHSEVKAWSQIKHHILGTYLSLFLGKLGSRGGPVYYVDGFAGQGRYDDGQPGSPLIAAEIAANPRQVSRRGILKCINVESDPDTFANLECATASHVENGIVTNYLGAFDDVLPQVLAKIGHATAFFFIDPFGTDGAVLPTLETLANRSGTTEVLVRYDDTRVHRLIQWTRNNLSRIEPKFAKTAEAFIPRIAGLTDDKAIAAVLGGSPEARRALIDGYLNLVKTKGLFQYGLSYPIRNPATHGHHYFLVHFCNYSDGYTYMANFMARVERTAEQQTAELFVGDQMEMMAINEELARQAQSANVHRIASEMPDLLRASNFQGKTIQLRTLLAAMVDQFQWHYTRAEWIAALRSLQERNILKLSGSNDGDSVVVSKRTE